MAVSALDLAYLAWDVYEATIQRDTADRGWLRHSSPYSHESTSRNAGFYGCLYQKRNTSEFVVAFRGTEPTDLRDLAADAAIAQGEIPRAQARLAERLVRDALVQHPRGSFTLTGHSLGGGLVQYVLSRIREQLPGATFNSADIAEVWLRTSGEKRREIARRLVNFRSYGCAVSLLTVGEIGRTVRIAVPMSGLQVLAHVVAPGPAALYTGFVQQHSIVNMLEAIKHDTRRRDLPPDQWQ
jgi:pimeloyl-ACP methyl ester carboxylesterase